MDISFMICYLVKQDKFTLHATLKGLVNGVLFRYKKEEQFVLFTRYC